MRIYSKVLTPVTLALDASAEEKGPVDDSKMGGYRGYDGGYGGGYGGNYGGKGGYGGNCIWRQRRL